ncbi:MAG: hypothetical protein OXU20_08875 [Myxococcales bacterium]|nr:hypothetical protein [Myxococcales bacterium]
MVRVARSIAGIKTCPATFLRPSVRPGLAPNAKGAHAGRLRFPSAAPRGALSVSGSRRWLAGFAAILLGCTTESSGDAAQPVAEKTGTRNVELKTDAPKPVGEPAGTDPGGPGSPPGQAPPPVGASGAAPSDARAGARQPDAEGGLPEDGRAQSGDPNGQGDAPRPSVEDLVGNAEVATGSVCQRGYDEPIVDLFCADAPVVLRSLAALQDALGIVPSRIDVTGGYALTGHSTALFARGVSSVNPRVIFHRFEHAQQGQELLALAFVRGEQTVEMVVRDRQSRELRFYVLSYEQACNARSGGCNAGHLLTPTTERGWRNLALRDDEDLKNTPLDCRQCHQPDGPGTPKLLRMQELDAPWTHWFDGLMPGGLALIDDYLAMKDGESLAGLDSDLIRNTSAALMEGFVLHGGIPQPNEFPSSQIEAEVANSVADAGVMQPEDNSIPGQSAAWLEIYETAKRGDAISVPYHDVKVTDPDKLARATKAYQSYLRGELAGDELPDFRDIYPDDPRILAEMGFATEPGLDGEGILMQACAQCHNRRLDQTISRAQFVADLASLDAEQKALATKRIQLPLDDPRVMPPAHFRRLSDEARRRLIDVLR